MYALPDAKVCVLCSVFAVGEWEDAVYQLIIHNRSTSQNHHSTQENQSSMVVTFSLLKQKSLHTNLTDRWSDSSLKVPEG